MLDWPNSTTACPCNANYSSLPPPTCPCLEIKTTAERARGRTGVFTSCGAGRRTTRCAREKRSSRPAWPQLLHREARRCRQARPHQAPGQNKKQKTFYVLICLKQNVYKRYPGRFFSEVTPDMYTLYISVWRQTRTTTPVSLQCIRMTTASKVKFWKPILLHSPALVGEEGRSFLRM